MAFAMILTVLIGVATYSLICVNDTPENRKQDDEAQMEWIKEYNNAH